MRQTVSEALRISTVFTAGARMSSIRPVMGMRRLKKSAGLTNGMGVPALLVARNKRCPVDSRSQADARIDARLDELGVAGQHSAEREQNPLLAFPTEVGQPGCGGIVPLDAESQVTECESEDAVGVFLEVDLGEQSQGEFVVE